MRMSHPHTAHRSAAFTLVEMLAVVTILSVAFYIILPTVGSTEVQRLKAAAQLLEADLNAAQIESITHTDDPRLISFSADNLGYHLAAASNPTTPLTHPATKAPYSVRFGQAHAAASLGVTIHSLSVGADRTLAFGPFGQLDQSTPATITLAAGPRRITLTLNATTGAITISPVQ
jgi:prepilin-type N-terminal cleavage/methylation domain-containing protein